MRKILTNGEVITQHTDGTTDKRILIVEDDGTVRALTAEQILERADGEQDK